MELMKKWHRIEYDNIPIYIHPEAPDWFVPNKTADKALVKSLNNEKPLEEIQHLLKRIVSPAGADYKSRSEQLEIDTLKECWLHVTNQCNMACGHCMFKSSPGTHDELTSSDCDSIIHEAYGLGCRLFYFTGGEPLLSRTFFNSVKKILKMPDTHVVVLTNLSLISRTKDLFQSIPQGRLNFQVSIDGMESNHNKLRGPGAFDHLTKDLMILRTLGFPVTLSMTVTSHNFSEMKDIVDFASQQQISSVHFLWLFQKGNADNTLYVDPDDIFPHLKTAQTQADKTGVNIDNIEIFRSQVFSCPATRYDLSNAAWQSIAVGPDGYIYPTPALIYTEKMQCGHINEGIKHVWRNSPVLKTIRSTSLNNSDTYRSNPFRYIIGGGDIDHSYIHSGQITGADPYIELYNNIVKWLIVSESRNCSSNGHPAINLKMGEKLGDCPAEGGSIFFTHSNCVLSLPGHDTRSKVNQFYTKAAEEIQEDILNPICYEDHLIQHIPKEMRYRSYGCGSPVLEADIRAGETVVDLGSGTGIECFVASKITGPHGRVIGIDMGDTMLAIANKTKTKVVESLNYDNIEFKKSFLETLPLEDKSVDLVVSNCVLNLSSDKRKVFSEISRVLKPNGRLVVSDITYNENIPLEIKYNETLRGECIGGALRYHDLFGLLNDIGFSHSRIVKGYHYREVKGYEFYSVTYQAVKQTRNQPSVLYDFPDFDTVMATVKSEPTCACFIKPTKETSPSIGIEAANQTGCMLCGAELIYLKTHQTETCHYCSQTLAANAHCTNGHFVCDSCHQSDAVEIIKQICLHSKDLDASALMQTIRSHLHFNMHGPEHHSLVPAVIMTVLRNIGYEITDEQINTGIERGQTIAGGACAFLGICGAAVGVGIAFSVLEGATPYDGDKRQSVQRITQQVLGRIASYDAPRCCQRDCWLALEEASRVLQKNMGKTFTVSKITCKQFKENNECIYDQCPLWPKE